MAERDKAGRWQPGASPNPSGRPRGSNRISELRAAIDKATPGILATLCKMARGGDVAAAKLLLDRTLPILRAADAPQVIAMPAGGLAAKGLAVLEQVAAGEVSTAQAAELLAGLGHLARVIEASELQRRIEALEAAAKTAADDPWR
jgi:hypothetical protein